MKIKLNKSKILSNLEEAQRRPGNDLHKKTVRTKDGKRRAVWNPFRDRLANEIKRLRRKAIEYKKQADEEIEKAQKHMQAPKARDWGRFNDLNPKHKWVEHNEKLAQEAKQKAEDLRTRADTYRKLAGEASATNNFGLLPLRTWLKWEGKNNISEKYSQETLNKIVPLPGRRNLRDPSIIEKTHEMNIQGKYNPPGVYHPYDNEAVRWRINNWIETADEYKSNNSDYQPIRQPKKYPGNVL